MDFVFLNLMLCLIALGQDLQARMAALLGSGHWEMVSEKKAHLPRSHLTFLLGKHLQLMSKPGICQLSVSKHFTRFTEK